MCVQGIQRSLQDLATDVLVVNIDAVGRQPLQRIGSRLLLVVRAGIETKLFGDEVQLIIRTHAANDGKTLVLGDLADDLAHSSCSAADEDGLPLLGLANLVQGRISRQAGHAQGADKEREVEVVRVVELEHALPGDQLLRRVRVLSDVDEGGNQVALLEIRAIGLEDLGDAVARHRPVQVEGWRVGLDAWVPHSRTHVGIEAADEILEDQAALGDSIQINGSVLGHEVLPGHWEALRDLLEDEGLVRCRHACGDPEIEVWVEGE